MNKMPFPVGFDKDLSSGRKRLSLRIEDEYGKYRVGEVYEAVTYNGYPIGVTVVIDSVRSTVIESPGILLDGDHKGSRSIHHVGKLDEVWFHVIRGGKR
jgi:hypothetical protein